MIRVWRATALQLISRSGENFPTTSEITHGVESLPSGIVYRVWIRHDGNGSIVCKARMEIAVNEDVCLCRNVSDSQRKPVVARTGLRPLCMISIECRYCNPLALCRLQGISDLRIEAKRDQAYKTIDF